MHRTLILAPLFTLIACPAHAAEQRFQVTSFDRVRVDGPFEVTIRTGTSPSAVASGDQRALDRVDVSVQGRTLVVRVGSTGWGETPAARAVTPAAITLGTPTLAGVFVNAGGRVTASSLRAQRADLAVNGSGSLTVTAIDADQLFLAAAGAGRVTLSGAARRARLTGSGPATIEAGDLIANDLTVVHDGEGDTNAAARFTAQVIASGLGRVTVTGGATCNVRASASSLVQCGMAR